jgi:RNA polymerase primary sigma factor
MRESLYKEIQRSLATLSEKERNVVSLYYGIGLPHGLTLEEIGEKFDLTSERVRQIKEKAIRMLKHQSRSRLLKTYLGQ